MSRGPPGPLPPGLTCALVQEVHGLLTGAEVAGRGLLLGILLHVGACVHGGVRAHGGARHVGQGDPAARAPAQHGLAHQNLGRRRHVKAELHLLLLVHLGGTSARVGGVEQHLVLAVGCVGCPEWRVIKNPELSADVLHVNLHLLHCTVEDAFSLFHRKRNFFRHEVAIIYWNPGPGSTKEKGSLSQPWSLEVFFFNKFDCARTLKLRSALLTNVTLLTSVSYITAVSTEKQHSLKIENYVLFGRQN